MLQCITTTCFVWVAGQFCEQPFTPQCEQLHNFLEKNLAWMQQQIQDSDDDYWNMVGQINSHNIHTACLEHVIDSLNYMLKA